MWAVCLFACRGDWTVYGSVKHAWEKCKCVFSGMRLGVCKDKYTGIGLVSVCVFEVSRHDHNKDAIHELYARKCIFWIIMEARKKEELMDKQVHWHEFSVCSDLLVLVYVYIIYDYWKCFLGNERKLETKGLLQEKITKHNFLINSGKLMG